MSAVSQLIDVTYKDTTSYVEESGDDILGIPFAHFWGPVGNLQVYNAKNFFTEFPEELPAGKVLTKSEVQNYFAYSQIKKSFENGLPLVEAVRVQGNSKYRVVDIKEDSQIFETVDALKLTVSDDTILLIASKYPGKFPSSLVPENTEGVGVSFAVNTDQSIDLLVAPLKKDDNDNYVIDISNIYEEYSGSINRNSRVSGESLFIEDLVVNSKYITVKVGDGAVTNPFSEDINDFYINPYKTDPLASIGEVTATEFNEALNTYFSDMQTSQATMLISPVATDSAVTDSLKKIAKERQDVTVAFGSLSASTFTKSSLLTLRNSLCFNSKDVTFSSLLAAREEATIFGNRIILDGTGGWCGATARVAKEVRTNQLASAFTYGSYVGSLTESLSFDDVCELHKKGINSIYSSVNGPLIFGVRAIYYRQTSYFAKLNVLRVLAKILKQIFPLALSAVHTDAASNPETCADYDIKFNQVIESEIAISDLKGDSYADCKNYNSDIQTQGGKYFNVVLSCHFIGLVEAIRIQVYATDSSVNAKIV